MAKRKKFVVVTDMMTVFRLVKFNSMKVEHDGLPVIKVDGDHAKRIESLMTELVEIQNEIRRELGIKESAMELDSVKSNVRSERLFTDICGDMFSVKVEKIPKVVEEESAQIISEK